MSRSNWYGFREAVSSGGNITYFGGGQAARLSAPDTNARAALYWEVPAIPGTTYRARFHARVTQGMGTEEEPLFVVDYPSIASPVQSVNLSSVWEEYTVSYTVPFDASPEAGDIVAMAFGVFTDKVGELEVTRPQFDVLNSPIILPNMMRESRQFSGGRWTAHPGGDLVQHLVVVEDRSSSGVLSTPVTWPIEFFPAGEVPPDGSESVVVHVTLRSGVPQNVPSFSVNNVSETGCDVLVERTTSTNSVLHLTAYGRWKGYDG